MLVPDSVVERLEVLLRDDVVGVEVEDVVEEVPELVLLEGGQELLPCHPVPLRVIAGVLSPSVWADCSLITRKVSSLQSRISRNFSKCLRFLCDESTSSYEGAPHVLGPAGARLKMENTR